MGKKNKIASKTIRKFGKKNKITLAVLGGVATGIAIAGILGTEKAKELLASVEDGVKQFGDRVANGMQQPART